MLLLACVLLYVAFPNRVNRAFALYLVLRGAVNVLGAFSDGGEDGFVDVLAPYYQLGATWAFLYFVVVFYELRVLGRSALRPGARVACWLFLAGALLSEAFYLATHARDALRFVEGVRALGSALLVLFLVHRSATLSDPRRRTAALLFAVGLGLDLVYLDVLYALRNPITPMLTGAPIEAWLGDARSLPLYALLAISVVPLLAAIALLVARRGKMKYARRAAVALGIAAAAGAFTQLAAFVWTPETGQRIEAIVDGLLTLAFPLLVAYAVLRHSMFDVDVRARLAVQRGTVGAAILAVGVIAAELVSNALNASYGVVAGSFAAGLMLLALDPLQNVGRRLAHAAVPVEATDDRFASYREQVEIAYSDGALSPKDRRHLELARTRLGLAPADAHRLEVEVAARLAA